MADAEEVPASKIVANRSEDPPPGFFWSVDVLDRAHAEAEGLLNWEQYAHLKRQVRELAEEETPTQCPTVDVRDVEDYYEIRDKGGVLGGLNIRVFFAMHKKRRLIVVLGVVKKENNGPTPLGAKRTMSRRKRLYFKQFEE